MGVVLLIACANLVNLLLVRSMAAALIHVDAVHKERLAWRAKLRGNHSLRKCALRRICTWDVPVENEPELRHRAKTANDAADRWIKNRDETAG